MDTIKARTVSRVHEIAVDLVGRQRGPMVTDPDPNARVRAYRKVEADLLAILEEKRLRLAPEYTITTLPPARRPQPPQESVSSG